MHLKPIHPDKPSFLNQTDIMGSQRPINHFPPRHISLLLNTCYPLFPLSQIRQKDRKPHHSLYVTFIRIPAAPPPLPLHPSRIVKCPILYNSGILLRFFSHSLKDANYFLVAVQYIRRNLRPVRVPPSCFLRDYLTSIMLLLNSVFTYFIQDLTFF